jgi:signal transduction histidine kinase
LENAIKYSVPDSEVLIRIQQLPKARCKVSVNNITKHMDVIPHFFEKGARGSHDGTGMGYGLFLAQLVARQHGAEIHFERVPYRNNLDNYIFYFELATIASAGTK